MSKLCIFLTVVFSVYAVHNNDNCPSSNAMGTVLFTASDIRKQCWSPDEIAVLTARMILEDLLPDISILHIDSNGFVEDIVNYFKLLIEVVRQTTQGRKKHITLLALTDLLGGYLQHAVLPISREAFYAGLIDYTSMEKLIELFEELKWFLRTNGQGWSKPIAERPEFEIEPINLKTETPKGNKSCCTRLIYYERELTKKTCPKSSISEVSVRFPLPFFDSKVLPTAIAIPFRRYPVRNIESRRAASLVLKFFVSAYQCLLDKQANQDSIIKFKNTLFSWIKDEIMPKLKDDKFYSAFGGILRVVETLKSLGVTTVPLVDPNNCFEKEDETVGVPEQSTSKKSSIVLVAMLVIILLWFIIGTAFICYRMKKNGSPFAGDKTFDKTRDKTRDKTLDKSRDKTRDKTKKYESTSSSFGSEKWSMFSKQSSRNESNKSLGCPCKSFSEKSATEKSITEKSIDTTSSPSSEYDYKEGEEKSTFQNDTTRPLTLCYPPHKPPLMLDDKPAVIEAKQALKMLPPIAEMSENSSFTRDDLDKSVSRRISFTEPLATSSKINVRDLSNQKKLSFSLDTDFNVVMKPCSKYSEKHLSYSSSKTKSVTGKDPSSHMEEDVDGCLCPFADHEINQEGNITKQMQRSKDNNTTGVSLPSTKDNTIDETTDDTDVTAASPHVLACHSSLTGDYEQEKPIPGDKPYVFGYDFQTSSSSELSDEDTEMKTSTSNTLPI